jgi:hypothetical protein
MLVKCKNLLFQKWIEYFAVFIYIFYPTAKVLGLYYGMDVW